MSKCDFWLKKVSFLGHVISNCGVAVSPKNVADVLKSGVHLRQLVRLEVSWEWLDTIGGLLRDSLVLLSQ